MTVTAGGILLPGVIGLGADSSGPPLEFPSTDHFWYRLQPAGRYLDSQRGNNAFGYADGTVFRSEDNGRTWPQSIAFPDAQRITFSHILRNGNILFATGSKLYLGTDNLKTYRQITVKARDGSDYLPHTPQNADNPGWYFHTLPGVVSWDVNGAEMVVWGNYCNVLGGADRRRLSPTGAAFSPTPPESFPSLADYRSPHSISPVLRCRIEFLPMTGVKLGAWRRRKTAAKPREFGLCSRIRG